MLIINGRFDNRGFLYAPDQRIEHFDSSVRGHVKHFFGHSACVNVKDPQGIAHRLFVPLSEVWRICPHLQGRKTQGVSKAFATALKVANLSPLPAAPSNGRTRGATAQPSLGGQHATISPTARTNVTPTLPGTFTIQQPENLNKTKFKFGTSSVSPIDKPNEKLQITIEKTKKKFSAFAMINGNKVELGYATTTSFGLQKNGNFSYKGDTSDMLPATTFGNYYYGPAENGLARKNHMCVDLLLSRANKQYKGIGSALMQAIMEYGYSKGGEGRIALEAAWNSFGFYYKLGMRTRDKLTNSNIARKVEKNDNEYGPFFGSYYMYMPKEAIETWKAKIKAQPIFKETLQCLQ